MSTKNPITGNYGSGPRVARRTGELKILRSIARQCGARFYAIGIPCRFGHLAGRYVSTKQCVECHAEHWLSSPRKTARRYTKTGRDLEAMRKAGREAFEAMAGARVERAKAIAESDRVRALIHIHNRRARKLRNGGEYSPADVRELYRLQRGHCAACHIELNGKFHQDHIMPLSTGGTNDKRNVQLLCRVCNQRKHARHPVDFMQSMGYLL